MRRIRRGVYRMRARLYGRLPKSRTFRKAAAAAGLLLALLVFAGLRVGQEKPETENKTQRNDIKWPEEGSLSVAYVRSTAVTVTPPEKELPAAEGGQSKEKPEEAVETGGTVVQSITGFLPVVYPKLSDIIGKKYLLENLKQLDYLKENFYIVNATTKMTEQDFAAEQLLTMDLTLQKKETAQILIYHTHASEGFLDSRAGKPEDTVIGMGQRLAEYLELKYGYQVLHDTTVFDKKDGKDNRSHAYSEAQSYIEELLLLHPEIEVVIDLHRDSGTKRVVTLQGRQVAKIMLFNGLSRNLSGELSYLPNRNLACNLAFSLQTKLIGDEMYPGLMHRIFLKDYRYNMHLMARYMLIELGTNNNTVEEAANAMEPLADILAQVLGK